MKVYEVETSKRVYCFKEDEYTVAWDKVWVVVCSKDGRVVTLIPRESVERISIYQVKDESDKQQ